MTSTGIGEAAVTILSETGAPSPLVHARLAPPSSLLGPGGDVDAVARSSPLWSEYGERVESESAREILAARLSEPEAGEGGPAADQGAGEDKPRKGRRRGKGKGRKRKAERTAEPATEQQKEASVAAGKGAEAIGKFLKSSQGKKVTSSVGRSLLGMLKR